MRFRPLLLSLLLAAPGSQAQSAPSPAAKNTPAYATDANFVAAMADAKHLSSVHQYGFAVDAYKKANKVAGGRCLECLNGEFAAQMAAGSYKDAAATATITETLATSEAARALAEYRRGEALYYGAGDKPKADRLEAAHAQLQEALTHYPKFPPALFLDGKILTQLGRLEEARAEFSRCASCASTSDPARLRAEHFAADPELSLHRMAPPFEVTALDGTRFNLDAMGGRVVLIDFWATWCGPCNAELPHMKRIAREFAGQPLVILSVSWDADEAKWKEFINKQNMTWMQYRDADHRLSEAFGVQAIPHYFTIDADGVLTAELMGEDADVEGKLKKLLAKARETPRGASAEAPAVSPVKAALPAS